jgi:hypothetical protein
MQLQDAEMNNEFICLCISHDNFHLCDWLTSCVVYSTCSVCVLKCLKHFIWDFYAYFSGIYIYWNVQFCRNTRTLHTSMLYNNTHFNQCPGDNIWCRIRTPLVQYKRVWSVDVHVIKIKTAACFLIFCTDSVSETYWQRSYIIIFLKGESSWLQIQRPGFDSRHY